jgi:hypothetical protein
LLNDINRLHSERNKNDWKDVEKRLEDYKKRWGAYARYKSLHQRSLLAKLDVEDRTGKRNDYLEEFNKAYLSLRTDFPEPKKRT